MHVPRRQALKTWGLWLGGSAVGAIMTGCSGDTDVTSTISRTSLAGAKPTSPPVAPTNVATASAHAPLASSASASASVTAANLGPLSAAIHARLKGTPETGEAMGQIETPAPGVEKLTCTKGSLYATSHGAFLVPAEFEQRWQHAGGILGWPVSEVEPWVDGLRQRFTTGNVIIAPTLFTDPKRLDVVVNKTRPLNPLNFMPSDLVDWRGISLRKFVRDAAEKMFRDATTDGVDLSAVSGFRSYDYQVNLFQNYQATQGTDQTLIRSARPGFSEHQTGFAFDVGGTQGCTLETCFADTDAAKWVASHAFEYGFTVRYGAGQTGVTGYDYEPWHLRFVGLEVARDMVARQIFTLEQYYGLPAAPHYPDTK